MNSARQRYPNASRHDRLVSGASLASEGEGGGLIAVLVHDLDLLETLLTAVAYENLPVSSYTTL